VYAPPVTARWLQPVLLSLCAACAGKRPAPAPGPLAESATLTISVVATNDVHGHIEQLPLLGGYLRNLEQARKRDHGAVLLLDAGDMLQGTLESNLGEGAAVIRAYNALGYAAASVGNHEFDFGPVGPHPLAIAPEENPLGALEQRVQEAHFPLLSANLERKDGARPAIPHVAPSVVLEVAGTRVGIVGGITRDALTQTQAANVAALRLAPLSEAIAKEARALRAGGASVVIALVHAGGECHDLHAPDDLSSCDPKAEIFELARQLSAKDVDLIVAGHTHEAIAHRVNGIPIIESYANARAFGRVDLSVDKKSGRVASHRILLPRELCSEALDKPVCTTESYEGVPVQRDPVVRSAIAADLDRARQERSRSLGVELSGELRRSHKQESALGNLVADLVRGAFPGADAAINNGGSVRTGLPAGALSYGQLFEMFPFDNAFAELHITAGTLATFIRNNLMSDRGFLSLSGLRASAHCEGEQLLVEISRPNGKRVAEETELRVITSDFLAAGGDGLFRGVSLGENAIEIHRDRMMRDAFAQQLEARARIDPGDRALFDPEQPRVRYEGVRPLRCRAQ
jgi:2',3'-cyclic-nucleotide 2'-phosphodiesterase (5'-nucleotidase family)